MFVENTTSATVGSDPAARAESPLPREMRPRKRVPSSRRRNPGVLAASLKLLALPVGGRRSRWRSRRSRWSRTRCDRAGSGRRRLERNRRSGRRRIARQRGGGGGGGRSERVFEDRSRRAVPCGHHLEQECESEK